MREKFPTLVQFWNFIHLFIFCLYGTFSPGIEAAPEVAILVVSKIKGIPCFRRAIFLPFHLNNEVLKASGCYYQII